MFLKSTKYNTGVHKVDFQLTTTESTFLVPNNFVGFIFRMWLGMWGSLLNNVKYSFFIFSIIFSIIKKYHIDLFSPNFYTLICKNTLTEKDRLQGSKSFSEEFLHSEYLPETTRLWWCLPNMQMTSQVIFSIIQTYILCWGVIQRHTKVQQSSPTIYI